MNRYTKPDYVETLLNMARYFVFLTISFTLSLGLVSVAHSGQSMMIFDTPQDPNDLAEILFPKRYRALVINHSPSALGEKPTNDQFGVLVNFKFDSTTIKSESLPLLDSVGEMLKTPVAANEAIVVEGHTDASGSDAYNQELSERRANAIKRYLVSIFEIDPDRLRVVGRGERALHTKDKPFDPINRRVTFRALSSKAPKS